MNTQLDDLISDRRELSLQADDDGAFPGSKEWNRANIALKALRAFDEAHPEVLAEIKARHSARVAVRDPFNL